MKIFLKVLLVVVLLILVIKLSPILFVATLLGLLVAGILGVLGFSLLTVLLTVLIGFTLALAPIWIPVLLILGLIALCKKSNGSVAPKVVA